MSETSGRYLTNIFVEQIEALPMLRHKQSELRKRSCQVDNSGLNGACRRVETFVAV